MLLGGNKPVQSHSSSQPFSSLYLHTHTHTNQHIHVHIFERSSQKSDDWVFRCPHNFGKMVSLTYVHQTCIFFVSFQTKQTLKIPQRCCWRSLRPTWCDCLWAVSGSDRRSRLWAAQPSALPQRSGRWARWPTAPVWMGSRPCTSSQVQPWSRTTTGKMIRPDQQPQSTIQPAT